MPTKASSSAKNKEKLFLVAKWSTPPLAGMQLNARL